ncbi:formin-binding protein [Blastocladiella emersonii ATCC 22665]|nr:formin-binding protein [Blastocladiella emersonii ATCC 22665]
MAAAVEPGRVPPAVAGRHFAALYMSLEDKGYKQVVDRLRGGKHTAKQFAEFVAARIALAGDNVLRLTKMAKILDNEDIGTTSAAMTAVKAETEAQARAHDEFRGALKEQVEKPLGDLIARQKQVREAHLATAERNMKARATAQQHYLRVRDKYNSRNAETVALRETARTKYGREQEKAAQRLTKLEATLKTLETEYLQAHEQLGSANRTWEADWAKSLAELEQLEVDRMDALRIYGARYAHAARELAVKEAESVDRSLAGVSAIHPTGDLFTFVHSLNLATDDLTESTGPLSPSSTNPDLAGAAAASAGNSPPRGASAFVPVPEPQYPPPPPLGTQSTGGAPPASAHATGASSSDPTMRVLGSQIAAMDMTGGLAGGLQPAHPPDASFGPASAGILAMPSPESAAAAIAAGNVPPPYSLVTGRLTGQPTGGMSNSMSAPSLLEPAATGASTSGGVVVADGGAAAVEMDIMDASVPQPVLLVAVARFAYRATIPEELSFEAGQELPILATHEDGWWIAETASDPAFPGIRRRGLVPSNFLSVSSTAT